MTDPSPRQILLVGGSGYVGTVLTDHLLRAGYRVRVFDRLIYDNQTVVPLFLGHPNFEFRYGDMTDAQAFASALEQVSDVVLLAGLVGDPITRRFPDVARHINDDGYDRALGMLNGRGFKRVIFVSTCSNYGLVEGDTLAHEDFALKPLSLYAEAKVKTEMKLLSLAGKVDYTASILRFATAFGLSPRMRFDLTVSEFTRALYLGEDLLVYDPDTWRPYCHVRDFARLIQGVLEAQPELVAFEVFNAGGEVNNFTKRMVVEAIRERLPRASVRYQEHGSDPRNYRVDFTKVRRRLGFEARFTVLDGIDELIAALDQGLFHHIASPARFFGNHDIDYPMPAAAKGAGTATA
jgi:nucleoside-diphosphate-sugar epimerase